jgi:hypothetical protein
MPVAAICPACRAPLSETSVLALAPICTRCGVVITSIGGTLGMTCAYGVGDPSITRRRVEADLAVFREYQAKYKGMHAACMQQLLWPPERYAHLPPQPELLPVQEGPSFLLAFGVTLSSAILVVLSVINVRMSPHRIDFYVRSALTVIPVLGCLAGLIFLVKYLQASLANGSRPRENARLERIYQESLTAALKEAERAKAAEDHRLRCQIRELEGLAKTVGEKAADVRRILATL